MTNTVTPAVLVGPHQEIVAGEEVDNQKVGEQIEKTGDNIQDAAKGDQE